VGGSDLHTFIIINMYSKIKARNTPFDVVPLAVSIFVHN
jgi:hypothetical protein